MKKVRRIIMLLVVIIFTFTSVFAVTPQNSSGVKQSTKESNQVSRFIIKYKYGNQSGELSKKLKNKLEKNKKFKNNYEMLETKSEMTVDELMTEIENVGLEDTIEYIQEDNIIKAFEENSVQGENLTVTEEVYVDNEVLVYPGLEQVWSLTTGENVIVGIIDTGIDINHEDLKNNIWVNSDEIPGDGIDQDGNGYADDVNGWNFAGDNNDSTGEGHGTAIAGIIAAEKDNGAGVAGIAPKAKVMPLKVFKDGQAYTSDILEAIEYARLKGVKVVNCSWGSSEYNQALREAIADSGMLFICAAGNNGADVQQSPVYPACFGLDNIISVASINISGGLSSFSNYSNSLVYIAAPGEEIKSTIPDNQYSKKNGTSIAAAFVSGEAVLVMSKYKEATTKDIKNRIIDNADKTAALESKVKGGSRINYLGAVTGNGITPVSETSSGTVAGTVYGDAYGFSLMSMEDGYSAPQDVTAQVISSPTDTANGQMKMSIMGNTLTNLLESDGDIESQGNWTSGLQIDNISKLFNNASGRIDNHLGNWEKVSENGTNLNVSGECVLLGFWAKSDSGTPEIDAYLLGYDNTNSYKSIYKLRRTSITNQWKFYFIKFDLTSCTDNFWRVRFDVNTYGTQNDIVNFDGAFVYNLTQEEFSKLPSNDAAQDGVLTYEQVKEKYGFVNSTKSVRSLKVRSLGNNLISKELFENIGKSSCIRGSVSVENNKIKFISTGNDSYTSTYGSLLGIESRKYAIPIISQTMYYSRRIEGLVQGATNEYVFYYDKDWRLLSFTHLYSSNGTVTSTFNVPENAKYLTIRVGATAANQTVYFSNMIISKNNVAYEPFVECIYYVPNTVELRSLPNGVKDEIDFTNGMYIKRVEATSGGTLTQLTQPEIYKLNTQPLICFQNGTIVVDNAVRATAVYNNGISISNSELPISELESVYKVEGSLMSPIKLSDINISSDGLSFTILGASNGNIYEYVYKYASELSTLPTIRYSVPTTQTAQINGTVEALNSLQKEVSSLKELVIMLLNGTNGGGTSTYQFNYDANGNLQSITPQQ